jgi:ribosomal protein S18 acetylase RimI-like enzyme
MAVMEATDLRLEEDGEGRARDLMPVRSLEADDLAAIVRIDRKITGRERTSYYERKMKEVLEESGIRVSVVGEIDDFVAGFIMARVDFGEFGRTDPVAVVDVIGVDPAYRGQGVGSALLSQLLTNLNVLMIETVRSTVHWDDYDVLAFLGSKGFAPSERIGFTRKIP